MTKVFHLYFMLFVCLFGLFDGAVYLLGESLSQFVPKACCSGRDQCLVGQRDHAGTECDIKKK